MNAVTVLFLGSGDAVGSGGRFQACILITSGDHRYLMDCGASSIVALKRGQIEPDTIDVVLISHLHGDHFAGLPFLVLDGQFAHRTRPLTIVGPAEIEERVRAAMINMYPGFASAKLEFPLSFVEIGDGEERRLQDLRLRGWSVPHDPLSNPLGMRLWLGDLSIGYSGDTAWTPVLTEIASGADLFICEAQTMTPKARIHISYAEVLAHRSDLQAKRIVLTHMGTDVLGAEQTELERAREDLLIRLE
jgi:ribonuclease BN (tRNA processing enzyme)